MVKKETEKKIQKGLTEDEEIDILDGYHENLMGVFLLDKKTNVAEYHFHEQFTALYISDKIDAYGQWIDMLRIRRLKLPVNEVYVAPLIFSGKQRRSFPTWVKYLWRETQIRYINIRLSQRRKRT